jgi:hypothetical protein
VPACGATVGYIGKQPETVAGAVLSAFLMVFGFLPLAMGSAALAAPFVRKACHRGGSPRSVAVQQDS